MKVISIYYNSETKSFSNFNQKLESEAKNFVLSLCPTIISKLLKLAYKSSKMKSKFGYDGGDWGAELYGLIGSQFYFYEVKDWIESDFKNNSLYLEFPYWVDKTCLTLLTCHSQGHGNIKYDFKSKQLYFDGTRVTESKLKSSLIDFYESELTKISKDSDNYKSYIKWLNWIISELKKL